MTKKNAFSIIVLIYFVIFLAVLYLTECSNTMIILRCVCLFMVLYCIYRGCHEQVFINPYWLFVLTPLSLLLYNENVSTYYLLKLDNYTWILILLNIGAFLAGLEFDITLSSGSASKKSDYSIRHSETDSGKLIKHSVILLVLGRMSIVYRLVFHSAMPLESVFNLFAFCSLACALKSRNIVVIVASLIGNISILMVVFGKTPLMFISVVTIVVFEKYYAKSKKQKIALIVITALFAAFMILVAFPLKDYMASGGELSGYIDSGNEAFFELMGRRIEFSGPRVLRMPYMYLISAWTNVQYILQTQDTRTYGLWMMKPFLGYLQVDTFFNSQYELIPNSAFNTFSFIGPLFKDFGYWGSCIGSFVLAIYTKWNYKRFLSSNDALVTTCYALVSMAVLEMFFSNHFLMLSYPVTIVIITYIYRYINKNIKL